MPRVSICIPAYNQPEFLRRTLDSVVVQSFQDYEVVITDDSTDDAVLRVAKAYLVDPRFQYFRNAERQGTPGNWNEAIRRAKAPLVKLLHHDDWFSHEHSLGMFVQMLDEDASADFAFCASMIVDERQQFLYTSRPTKEQLRRLRSDPMSLFAGNFIGAPSATIFRKQSALVFDTNLKWLVDIDFYIAILKINPNFGFNAAPEISTTLSEFQVSAAYRRDGLLQLAELIYLRNKLNFSSFNLPYTYQFIRQAVGLLGINGLGQPLPQNAVLQHPSPELQVALVLHSARKLLRAMRPFKKRSHSKG